MNIKDYGFTDEFESEASEYEALTAARITSQERGLYTAVCSVGEVLAELSGRLMYKAETANDYPAVGDFVMLDLFENSNAVIHSILSRKSVFFRRAAGTPQQRQIIAANVDTVFICTSLNSDFNLRRLERYISAVSESGASPVIVLTKCDLCDPSNYIHQVKSEIAGNIPTIETKALAEEGYSEILPFLPRGKTAAFAGSSGVGKSTLINRLLNEDRLETSAIRGDGRGRHTTTRRELILLPSGAMVIDTPGMREFGLYETYGVDAAFSDVGHLTQMCRYKNCSHGSEPGCAVQAAILDGKLTAKRWQSYIKLKNEVDYAADSESYMKTKKNKFREIAKQNRKNNRRRG